MPSVGKAAAAEVDFVAGQFVVDNIAAVHVALEAFVGPEAVDNPYFGTDFAEGWNVEKNCVAALLRLPG